jgi:tetratricopeptide (TPR) repeat protein
MKCALCQETKGKRGCKLNSAHLICPPCCASIRRTECEGCSYYAPNLAYQRDRRVGSKTFVTEIIPEVDDRCDAALALVEEGKIAKGETLLRDLQRQHPNYHTVLYGLGVCHCMKKQTDEAIACLERAVEIFPPFAHAHYNLGSSYCQKVDLERAVRAYEAAIAADGPTGSVGKLARERLDELTAIVGKNGVSLSGYIHNRRVFDRAFLALRDGKLQTAIELFSQVLATEKGHVQSYGNMAIAYAGLGNKQKALECLDKAIELDPQYEPALVNRLAVEKLKEGERLPNIGGREVNYYSEFKLEGRSYLQQLVNELGPDGEPKLGPSGAGSLGA